MCLSRVLIKATYRETENANLQEFDPDMRLTLALTVTLTGSLLSFRINLYQLMQKKGVN